MDGNSLGVPNSCFLSLSTPRAPSWKKKRPLLRTLPPLPILLLSLSLSSSSHALTPAQGPPPDFLCSKTVYSCGWGILGSHIQFIFKFKGENSILSSSQSLECSDSRPLAQSLASWGLGTSKPQAAPISSKSPGRLTQVPSCPSPDTMKPNFSPLRTC